MKIFVINRIVCLKVQKWSLDNSTIKYVNKKKTFFLECI